MITCLSFRFSRALIWRPFILDCTRPRWPRYTRWIVIELVISTTRRLRAPATMMRNFLRQSTARTCFCTMIAMPDWYTKILRRFASSRPRRPRKLLCTITALSRSRRSCRSLAAIARPLQPRAMTRWMSRAALPRLRAAPSRLRARRASITRMSVMSMSAARRSARHRRRATARARPLRPRSWRCMKRAALSCARFRCASRSMSM